jgi:nucleoside-diphosphate kinase
LRLVFVRAERVFGGCDLVVWKSFVVDAIAVRVADLFVRRAVAFDRALVHVGIAGHLGHHRGHRSLLTVGMAEKSACYNRRMTERTLAIIKPDAVEGRLTGKIIQRIEDNGFQIRAMRLVRMSPRDAEGFYAVHRGRPFFNSLTQFMSSGAAIVMVLEAPDAIRKWRTLMGATDPAKADPGTLRKEFAQSIERNATHGSDAPDTAAYEIGYFFPAIELV